MLQRAFAFHLDKSLQRTDWTRRPLPPAMVAYAARDAEVTLALYYWLNRHYPAILRLHEVNGRADLVAPWIEPFLRGNSPLSPEMAVSEARARGQILNRAQVMADCRAALVSVTHPMRRSRLLRLIADLSLTQLTPDILPLLQAGTSDERCGSVRALGRLGIQSAQEAIHALLRDPVQDVRKAAQTALRSLSDREPRVQRVTPVTTTDGTRRWTVDGSNSGNPQPASDDEHGWKSRLRSIID
jgi:ribonuclease D